MKLIQGMERQIGKRLFAQNIYIKQMIKTVKDKRRQNFRKKCLKYKLINKALHNIKTEKEVKIYLRIPFQIEKEDIWDYTMK